MEVSLELAKRLAVEHFGIGGNMKKLPGEADYNFYLKSEENIEYLLKVGRPEGNADLIDLQAGIMEYLDMVNFPLRIPQCILSKEGKSYVKLANNRFLRLQKWIPGKMLAEANPRTPLLLEHWGQTCGLFSAYLKDFDHPAAHRFYKWDPTEGLYSKKYRSYLEGESKKSIGDYFWDLFEKEAAPHLHKLRKSVNYNDAHEHNLLINNNLSNPSITGVIDFGDVLYTQTVNELAIACAYAGMCFPDPLQAVLHVVRGYHQNFPLKETELLVLFPLIGARLMITVANAAWNRTNEPNNKYLSVSEKPAWGLLEKFRKISPAFAHYAFRQVCGMVPCPMNFLFQNWIKENQNSFGQVVRIDGKLIEPIDLSVGSVELGNNSNFESIEKFQLTISRLLEDKNTDFGFGGYGEIRPVYTTQAFKEMGNSGVQWRTVHLGLDIWGKGGTSVFAPMDGTIHSFQNNIGDRNYGPTIILKHQISNELAFYTLYGHLSLDSLSGLEIGKPIQKGRQLAKIGVPPENGNWPPHLHFQIILDMLGKEGDFPGVAFPAELEIWLSICPDPGLIISQFENKFHNLQKDEILAIRKENLGKSLSISYHQPLHIVRGYKQYLYDDTGRRYLDTVNNVPHVGHQHPRVVRAARNQIALLNTNTRYLHEHIVQFAHELLTTLPAELSVVHFVNSGSEANELALRMSHAYTGQKDMIAVEVGYHGNTSGCIAVSSYKFDGKGGEGAPPYTNVVPIPDTYRGLYRDKEEAGEKYAGHIKNTISNIQSTGRNISGFICESILSCGGQIVLPKGYLKAAYHYVHQADGLCIADEVQVGFGRVGQTFWGFELQGVVPDIVTMGKPMGNGHPLAAVITTQEVAERFANGMEYFNTFGGNPVSCAIGREVLKIIQEEGLQQHALQVGKYLTDRLIEMQAEHTIIGDVRGHGLFLGIELVKNRETLKPASEEAEYLVNRMRERGILMSIDGPLNNVLKIKPPMCFTKSDADFVLENLEIILGEDFLLASQNSGANYIN